jgi:hypothetical protein
MRIVSKTIVAAAFVALFVLPKGAVAQERITCESNNNRRSTCYIRDLDQQSVRLVDRLSSAACINGRSWGTNRDGIWVDEGCRARFSYDVSGGRRGSLTCESEDGDLKNCRVPGLVENSVRLTKRLSNSSCINGRTWGTMPDIIWVESGCRAEFSFEARGGGNRWSSGNTKADSRSGNAASELRYIVGMRASSGERELENRGFRDVRTLTTNQSRLTYWYNSRRDECVVVTTRDGEYKSVIDQPLSVCR